ncbi:MAG: SpoIIE family protein phosphatase [Anaerolineae bacterium]|nr:SpoIIE family protein phosphatase [Anaerolineae bacterium]
MNPSQSEHHEISSSRESRPTIGLICDIPWNQYSCDMWAGVRDAAWDLDANLLYFAGGILDFAVNYRQQANIIYDRITPDALDGLVVWGGQLAHIVGAREVFKFCQHFQPLPMISIELDMEGIPSLFVDNHRGIYDIVSHLIEVHGFTKLAYIDYPTNFPVTIARYQGYADALRDHGILLNPKLITDGSGVDPSSDKKDINAGYEGINVFFEQRKLRPGQDIEAIVTVADPTALAALKRMQACGIRVPEDVALVGFDDIDEVRYQHPPLTTVRQSFYEQGWKATEALLTRVRGGTTPDRINLAPQVVVRRSCGCADPVVERVSDKPAFVSLPAEVADCGDTRRIHREAVLAAVRRAASDVAVPTQTAWAEGLADSFVNDIHAASAPQFLAVWETVLYEVENRNGALIPWQNVLSEWRHLFPAMSPDETLRAETLWQQARILLGDLIQRHQGYQRLMAAQRTALVHEVSNALITTFDLDDLMNVLARELPRLNISGCYLALYETAAAPTEWARLVLAYDQNERRSLPPEGLRIPPHRLLPHSLVAQNLDCNMMVAPLYFQATQIGFAMFAAGQSEGIVYEVLRNQLGSALQGALLVRHVQRNAEEIHALNQQLQAENLRMGLELDISRRIQQMVLPSTDELQRIVGMDIAGYMQPADEVGGDYYDVLLQGDILHVGIGDVTGHGLESGVLMLMTQTAIRTLIEHGEADPVAFLKTLNRVILKNADRMQVDKTLTLTFVQYQDRQLRIVGQHEDLLLVRQGGYVERIDTLDLGFPLGLESEIEKFVNQATVMLEPGDGIVLYTDGVVEAENAEGQFYGIDRLCRIVAQHWDRPSEEIKQAVVKDVTWHIGSQRIYDDLTLLVIKQE